MVVDISAKEFFLSRENEKPEEKSMSYSKLVLYLSLYSPSSPEQGNNEEQ